jgi:hypothetical protein
MFSNYAGAASLVVGLVLPAIVALFTRPSTNPTVKGIVHAVLSVATGFWAVHQAEPQHFYWAPAVVAAFLAWVTGTTFYHSLLKKYAWFATLQNTLVTETESRLHISPGTIARYVEETQITEAPAGGTLLGEEVVEQISRSVEDAVRRVMDKRVVESRVSPPAASTIVLPKVNGLGTRSI